MSLYKVMKFSEDGNELLYTRYIRAIRKEQAEIYCRLKYGGERWRAYPITIEEVDIEGKCDICGQAVPLGNPMCESCYRTIRYG